MSSPTLLLISVTIALFISLTKRTYEVSELLEKTVEFGIRPELELPYVQTLYDQSCKYPLPETNMLRLNNKCLNLVKDDPDFIQGKEIYLKCDDSDDTLIVFSEGLNVLLYGIGYDSNNNCKEIVKLQTGTLITKNPIFKIHPNLRIVKRNFLYPHTNVSIFTVLNFVQHEYSLDQFDKILPTYMRRVGYRFI